jgi:hypothetical protein
MNRVEAKWILLRTLVEYRRFAYDELRTLIGNPVQSEIVGPSGAPYQLEIDFLWDSKPGGDIRILGSIDDGGWRACCPLGYSDLVPPPRERH